MDTPPVRRRWWLPDHPADKLAWAAVAVAAGGLLYALGRFWGANPGHADRLLILLGAGYAAHTLAVAGWGRVASRPLGPLGLVVVAVAVAVVPSGAYLLGRAGPRALTLWWLAGGVLAAAVGLVLTRFGTGRLRAAAFPLLFALLALPIPTVVLAPLQDKLQGVTTSLAVPALRLLGEPAEREGFVITLPNGRLGVEEACSGVRSLTALTAIAAFVAFLRGFGPGRGVALVLLAVPLVVAVNAGRVVASGLIQEHVGQEYMTGDWHEALGFAAVLAGLGLILVAAEGLGKSAVAAPPGEPLPPPRPGVAGLLAAGLLAAAAVGGVGLGAKAGLAVAATRESAALETLSPTLGDWTGADQPVPAVVTEMLSPDRTAYRVFTSKFGQEAHVWVMYWASGSAIKGLHQPEICWGGRGFVAADTWDESITPAAGGALTARVRDFRQGRQRQTVAAWTQEGRRVLGEVEERERESAGGPLSVAGRRWVADYLGAADAEAGGRLTVVVALTGAGPQVRRDAADLVRRLADDLYRVCPWAVPAGP